MLDQLERQVRKVILAAQVPQGDLEAMAQWALLDPKEFLGWSAQLGHRGSKEYQALLALLVPQARRAIRERQVRWATRARWVQQARLERQA